MMLAKMFNIGTIKATGLLNHVVRDTATDINTVKLNCVEDCRIRWMTYQNLGSLVRQLGGVLGRLWFCNSQHERRACL